MTLPVMNRERNWSNVAFMDLIGLRLGLCLNGIASWERQQHHTVSMKASEKGPFLQAEQDTGATEHLSLFYPTWDGKKSMLLY